MSASARRAPLARRWRVAGQAAVEYVGMLLVAATVVALIAASDVAATIADAIDSAICQVSSGRDANCDSSGDKFADGDEKSRARETDADADGLSDREERRVGTLPGKADSDADGLLDGDELQRDTNPTEPDSDGDGISDGDEVKLSGQRSRESGQDFDPTKRDGDGDGLDDGQELALGTPPGHPDADHHGGGGRGDGLSDADEVLRDGTDPAIADTDARRNLQAAAKRRLEVARNAPAASRTSRGATGAERGVDDVIEGLPRGRQPNVRTVGSDDKLRSVYDDLARGGTAVDVPGYPGRWVELRDGTRVGIREGSKSGGAAIDIRRPDGSIHKVHIQ